MSSHNAAGPGWFRDALAQAPQRSRFIVDGAGIELLTWGPRGAPGLLFVHGMGAHADWWRFIAPFFTADHRVAAISFSGMGGSDRRERYDFRTYSSEILRGAREAGLTGLKERPFVVAHSLGTIPAILAASTMADEIGGLVLVDAPMGYRPARTEPSTPSARSACATLEEARRRFQTRPATHCAEPYVMEFLAETSLEVEHAGDGQVSSIRRKLDPRLKGMLVREAIGSTISDLHCPLWMMRGEASEVLTIETRAWLSERLPPQARWIEVPAAGHQVMLDQPLAFVAAIRSILAFTKVPPREAQAEAL